MNIVVSKSLNVLALGTATLIALAASESSVRAQLLVNENFGGYTNGTSSILAGENGGSGWGSAWTDKNNLSGISSTALGYTDGSGNVLNTSANSTFAEQTLTAITTTGSSSSSGERILSTGNTLGTLAAANGAVPGTVWMSYLWQDLNNGGAGGSYRQASLMFLKGATTAAASGTEYLDLGVGNITNSTYANPNFALWGANGNVGTTLPSTATLQSSVLANSGNTLFVLVQMTLDATTASDTINVWLDPTLTQGTPSGAANITYSGQDLTSINGFRLQSGGLNANFGTVGGQQEMGQLLIGDTAADVEPIVVPEPATLSLAALGGLSLLAFRRRKS